ncbi:hypothetical protein RhiirA5_482524 [Rhizophagus irregularis]|uniref:Uncharacterized protein n=1 Tax=Rhizophagus irregularis TaxID=588596 RepID=A0A2N0NGK6_9GLOM|nr:hypothetical protein RhiirA5_482524 [Rhizophagus irregularis]
MPPFKTELPYLLGSTNPCPITVHMEPFSTSVFKFIRQVSCYTLLSGFRLPWPPSCCLDELTPFVNSFCYPEGNFGRNQLLDGSISLSPLYPNLTIDLHVRTATSLHQSFL